MSDYFKYDVFLSYSSMDKPVVRSLAKRLKSDGLRVWFDEWEIRPGDMIGKRIEEGLEASRVLVLAMSTHTFQSEWATLESGTFRFRDPTNKERRFVPLRLDDAEIKDTLKQFAYVDWRDKSGEEYARLLAACRIALVVVGKASHSEHQVRAAMVLKGHREQVLGVKVTADGQRAISGSYDGTVRVWNLQTGELLRALRASSAVFDVAMSANGQKAVSASENGFHVPGPAAGPLLGLGGLRLCYRSTSDHFC